jgi:hypothetical protein
MKNEFDNKLTDKGWQSMRRLLDREMPEQRRRRRFAWWPFALLLLPLAGWGGWWVLRGDEEPEKINPPVKEAPKVSEPVAEAVEGQNIPAVVGVPANNKRWSEMPNEEYRTFVQPRTSGVVGGDANNGPKNGEVFSPPRLVFSPSDDEANRQDPANHEVVLGENTKYGAEDLTTFKRLPNLNKLPVISQFVENEIKNTLKFTPVTPFAAAPTKKHTEPKHWSFGLSAGLASENLSALNGFTAGAAADWQFARKWGLRSGLHYGAYRLSAEERPVVSLDSDDYQEATGNSVDNLNTGGGSTPNSSDPGSVLVPIERLRQLEIPLLAYWQPVRPLRIFGGFSLGYSLSTQASEQNYASGQLYYANTKIAQDNLNDLAVNNLPRWRTALQTGIGIRLGKHFELDAFYRHGMSGLNSDIAQDNFNPASPNYLSSQSGDFKNRYFLLQGIWFF